MIKLENKKYSFWELLTTCGIKIPIIQRDYAQGRDNNKVKDIRENFLNSMFEVVIDINESVDLDFIYGTLKNNFLIPLDGQQRLTTLFLLHYYLAYQDDVLNKENKEILEKFTYDTRVSSREFCSLLINKELKGTKKHISESIKDQSWFFSTWENDPTINAMLVMLDAIEDKFKEEVGLFSKLIDRKKQPITFSFLNLDDFELTDELYIKMNARGKPLSDFENFKSKFEEFIKDEDTKANLDNKWLDIFWKANRSNLENAITKDKENIIENNIFGSYLKFFKNITPFFDLEQFNKIDMFKHNYKNDIGTIVKVLNGLEDYQDSFIYPMREYKIFKINIFKDFIEIDNAKSEYEIRSRFYALMKFFIAIGSSKNNEELFRQWMRISLNIINNTLFNNDKDFKNIIYLLDNLSIKLNINSCFYESIKNEDIKGFSKDISELLKAEMEKMLLTKDKEWESTIIETENNWYLDGRIVFLLNYANTDFDKFVEYKNKFIKLWKFAKENKEHQILIYQALLTLGNYLPSVGSSKFTFCSFDKAIRSKKYGWWDVFDKKDEDNYLFKVLLDDIGTDIQKSLEKIIQDWMSLKNTCVDRIDSEQFLYRLISNNENIKYCKKLNLSWKSDRDIFLIKSINRTTISELYTYSFYTSKQEKLQSISGLPFEIKYNYEGTPSISMSKWQYHEHIFSIDIKFIKNKFSIEFFDKNEKIVDISDDIKDILTKFKLVNNIKYINDAFGLCDEDELMDFLINLTSKFNKI